MNGNSRPLIAALCALFAADQSSPARAADAPAAAQPAGGLEEVIVTAQKRSENLQAVPISVAALSADALAGAGVQSTETLSTAVPGLVMTRQARGGQPYIRGVGSQSTVVGNENAVASYIDGVYIADSTASLFYFNNVERVEVLRGPQGTLFGRNATGGAINVVTRDPKADPSLEGSISYGDYDTWQGSLYATGGVERLAADLAVYALDQGQGFGKFINIPGQPDANYRRDYAVRSKILWTPTDEDRFTLSGDWETDLSDVGLSRTAVPGSILSGGLRFAGTIYDSMGGTPTLFQGPQTWGASVRYERTLHVATLTVISAYRLVNNAFSYDQDSQAAHIIDVTTRNKTKTFQNEIYLTGATGRLQWTAGAFIFNATASVYPLGIMALAPAGNTRTFSTQEGRSYAGYAQSTYALTDSTHVTGGFRYTLDSRDFSGMQLAGPRNPKPAGTVLATRSASVEYGRPTWRLSIDQQLSDDILGYVSYNRGYKAGTFNLTSIAAPPVGPETLDAYEAGLKSELFHHLLRLNLAGFHYDYTNVQITTVQGGQASFFNAANATINGGEIEATFAPAVAVGDLSFDTGLSILDAKYDSFPNGPINTPLPTGGNLQKFGNLSGHTMIHAPKWTLTLSTHYTIPVGDGEFGITGDFYHSDSYYWEVDNRLRQPAYNLLNGELSYAFDTNERYRIRIFGQNLLNERYYTYVAENSFGDTGAPAAPLTFGVGFEFKL